MFTFEIDSENALVGEVILGSNSEKRTKWFSTANRKFSLPIFPPLVMRPQYVKKMERCFFNVFNEKVCL